MAIARATAAFECVKGEDYQINWTIQTSDTDSTPVDITGWTFAMSVKRQSSDSTASVITPTITTLVAASGTLKAVFAAAGTVDLDGDYQFDLWRTNAGSATCLCSGRFSVIDTPRN